LLPCQPTSRVKEVKIVKRVKEVKRVDGKRWIWSVPTKWVRP
jgi:hypothetical protein